MIGLVNGGWPIWCKKPGGGWQAMEGVEVERVAAVGPRGWRLAIEQELDATRR